MLSLIAAAAAALALVSSGTMAGLFFVFSNAVMPGLDAIEGRLAIAAMRSINRTILNPLFLVSFLAPPVAAAVAGIVLLALDQPDAAILCFAAAGVYALGTLAPTGRVNVPLNQTLDRDPVPTDAADADRAWAAYSTRWTRWNTLRAVASAATLGLIGLALFVWGRQG